MQLHLLLNLLSVRYGKFVLNFLGGNWQAPDVKEMLPRQTNNHEVNKARGKRITRKKNWGEWSELYDELLYSIFKLLNVVDFLSMRQVCRSWRACALMHMKEYLNSIPPLVVLTTVNASRTCRFLNMFGRNILRTRVPNFAAKAHLGFSCGYLIMKDRDNELWVLNPLRGKQINFPIVPFDCERLILVSTNKLSHDVMAIAVTSSEPYIQVCDSSNSSWSIYPHGQKKYGIVNLAVFKGKIHALTKNGKLWELSFPDFELKSLDVKNTPLVGPFLHLVAVDEHLLMLNARALKMGVYRLDFSAMEWVKISSLGDQALFVCDAMCGAVSNPSKCGGRSNCIYHLLWIHMSFYKCFMYSFEGRYLGDVTYGNEDIYIKPPLWYFAQQAHDVDFVIGE
ncbi:hypothetical protein Ancab_027005 [Ancistrocladus abbreviatus]